MADKSGIEWTDSTWNPIVGCSIVSPGCTNCYAMKMAARIERMSPGSHYAGTTQPSKSGAVWTGKLALAPDHILTAPLRWKRPRKIFVNSMGDLFHEDAPEEWIMRCFAIMALSGRHTFQILTKRADRMLGFVTKLGKSVAPIEAAARDLGWTFKFGDKHFISWPIPNIWLGVSTERQQEAEERIPLLLDTPAAVRFISAEPLLAPIDLAHLKLTEPNELTVFRTINALTGRRGHGGKFGYTETCDPLQHRLDWAIIGGESGHGARPMNLEWARSLRDQCTAAGVSFFMKQIDGRQPIPADLMVRQFPNRNAMAA